MEPLSSLQDGPTFRAVYPTPDQLQARMATLDDGELHAIVAAASGVFTNAARDEATKELRRRENDPSYRPVKQEMSFGLEDQVFWLTIRRWWELLVPADLPQRLRQQLSIAVAAVFAGILVLVDSLSEYVSAGSFDRWPETSQSDITYMIVALAGLLLAFSIRTRRTYARHLAAAVAIVSAAFAIAGQFRSGQVSVDEIYAIAAGAVATVYYLFRDQEVVEYYRGLSQPTT